MIDYIKNLFNKSDSQYISELITVLEELKDRRVGLVIQHTKMIEPFYGIISDYDIKQRRIAMLDLTPNSGYSAWVKNEVLNISSTPQRGRYFIFEGIILSLPNNQSHHYSLQLPESYQTIDIRKFPRIRVDCNRVINVNVAIANPDESDQVLKSILSTDCIYEGTMFDISLGGMQVVFKDDCRDLFSKGMIVKSDIIFSNDINFSGTFEVRWIFYNRVENITRLGCYFVNLNPNEINQLKALISSIQASYYHRYA